MEQQELIELAAFLAQNFPIQVPEEFDPLDPSLLIQVFINLFPSSQQLWSQVSDFDAEEQWNAVIQFIQINLLDGNSLEMQSLDIQQLLQIYSVVVQYAEKVIVEREKNKISKKEKQLKKEKTVKDVIKQRVKEEKGKKPLPKNQQRNERKKAQSQTNKISSKEEGEPKIQKITEKRNKLTQKKRSKKVEKAEKAQKEKGIEQKNFQQELQEKIVEAISKPLHKVDYKTDPIFRDTKGVEAVQKADRQFAHFLKEYQREKVLKRKIHPLLRQKNVRKTEDQVFLKAMEKKQKALQDEVTSQQIKYLLALRDRKVAFINKIHRLTEELQRERQIDWAHQQRQIVVQNRKKTAQEIAKTEAVFQTNMQLLRQQYKENRNRAVSSTRDELQICRQMGKALEGKKKDEMERMKVLWEQENAKLSSIVGDEERVKSKLIDLYRKNRP